MNILWFIAVVLIMVFFQGFAYSRYVSRALKVERSFGKPNAAPGETVALNIAVTNKSLLPLTWVHMEESVPVELKLRNDSVRRHYNNVEYIHNIVMSLLPLQRVNRRYSVEFTKRGYYELKQLEMNIADLLGDSSHACTIQAPASIVIYPRLADMSDSLLPASGIQGDISVNRWILDDPTMLIGHREYARGDSFKSINWKRTAKERQLMVNRHDFTSDQKFMVLLDMDELEDIWSSKNGYKVERAIEVCAFVCERLITQGIPTGFATNALYGGSRENGILEPGAGNNQLGEVMDCLGRIQYYRKSDFEATLDLAEKESGWGTEFIIVVPRLREQLVSKLRGRVRLKVTIITMEPYVIAELPGDLRVFVCREDGDANAAV